jgi:mRNA interferase MazF
MTRQEAPYKFAALSTERLIKKLGQVSDETLQELLSCLIVCVDYELS